jgi:hypothetical protein
LGARVLQPPLASNASLHRRMNVDSISHSLLTFCALSVMTFFIFFRRVLKNFTVLPDHAYLLILLVLSEYSKNSHEQIYQVLKGTSTLHT